MSAGRRSARRRAVFILYQQDLLKLGAEAALRREQDEELSDYARQVVLGTEAEREQIDLLVDQNVTGWSLERLGVLERSILRVAAYELLREIDVPVAVVIDEAVNLAKRFCSGEAGALINGVLGSLAATARAQTPKREADTERTT